MLTSCLSGTRKASLSCDEIRKPNRTVFGLKPGRRLFGPSGKQEEGLQRNKLKNAKKETKRKEKEPFWKSQRFLWGENSMALQFFRELKRQKERNLAEGGETVWQPWDSLLFRELPFNSVLVLILPWGHLRTWLCFLFEKKGTERAFPPFVSPREK